MVTHLSSAAPRPSQRRRLAAALAIGAACGWYRWHVGTALHGANDFGQVWFGARALLSGLDPYALVGPGRAYNRPWPLPYPGAALVSAVPFAPLSEQLAAATFTGLSAAACAYALTRHRWAPLAAFASLSMWAAVQLAQWAPLLTAAAVLPWLGFALAAKPTVGLAMYAAHPTRRAALLAAGVTLVSLAVLPRWPAGFLANARTLTHLASPVAVLPAGPLLLLALLRWRRPEARLLAALACVPQTLLLYEAVPLFLVTATAIEAWCLTVLTWVAMSAIGPQGNYPSFVAWADTSAARMVLLIYLPCLVMVLRRPNEGAVPAWLDRLARRGARVAGRLPHSGDSRGAP